MLTEHSFLDQNTGTKGRKGSSDMTPGDTRQARSVQRVDHHSGSPIVFNVPNLI